jgi:NADH:ubiquinone oxidoreductase subunit H
MHAGAAVFMAFCRPAIIRSISGNREIEPGMLPGIRDMGFRWFFIYSLILIFLHHLLFFFLEVFRFDEFLQTMYRVLLSTAGTLVLVILAEYLFMRSGDRN